MTKWFTLERILVSDLNVNILSKFLKFFNWYVHVLELPLRILATIDAHC